MSTLEFQDDFSEVLERALTDYESVLKELEESEEKERSPSTDTCLQILLLRDKIQTQVTREHPPSTQAALRLISLDERLSEQGGLIAQTLPLDKFRDLIDPPESAWWWYVQPPEEIHPWDTFNWLWELLTVPILASNFALVAAISSRFLAGGPDAIGAFATIGQGLIALLAAGAPLSKVGQQVIERSLTGFNLPKYLWHEAKLTLALAVFLGLLGFQAYLPNIARFYVRRGIAAQRQFQTTLALAQFQRALELDPNNMEAHFRLGNIYEDLLEFDKAQAEYRVALLGDCIEAYNNLGRLYIVQSEDYTGAAALLRQGQLKLENRETIEIKYCSSASLPAIEYIFLKNLGWARLMQDRPFEAESELRKALEINPQDASPHCLLAQALEAQNKQPAAVLEQWQQCYALARGFNSEEDTWLDLARQRLSQAESEDVDSSGVPAEKSDRDP
ncbi:tetratricopeptide repeat protein [Sodalinema gerasimenkoae]|uniref:tetratricopeptide repeat protein n=1 Tax=Sodalinema gerasimenkoae TaxID=2862348 RepID=UPI001356EF4B|nr:tetratricopeptide repeat protein [Sodalinema gerasimenkoae]